MLRRLFLSAVAVTFLLSAAAAGEAQTGPTETLVIETPSRRLVFAVEIARDSQIRERGLMFRQSLAEDQGMLFIYETPQRIAMWMKNTFIPLDMVFIRADGSVTEVVAHTVPHSLDTIQAAEMVIAVLEIAGGTSQRLGIAPGAIVRHRFFGNLN